MGVGGALGEGGRRRGGHQVGDGGALGGAAAGGLGARAVITQMHPWSRTALSGCNLLILQPKGRAG